MRTGPVFLLLLLGASARAAEPPSTPSPPLQQLSLEELLETSVVSASNTAEKLPEAPATVIVLTREDISQRGYTEMSQILDDLPGMDVVRPYGDTYFKDYWRGYRNSIGEPFLLLLDGMVLNHLYFNTADSLTTLPLSNVDRIEVVYGPASSVYGPNAFMGVINVITIQDRATPGATQTVRLSAGSAESRVADANLFYKGEGFRLSLTARLDNGNLAPEVGERYEYTHDRYYSDPLLFGGFIQNPNLGGHFSSPHQNRALDARAYLGPSLEAGIEYHVLDAGYGVEYAADRTQNHAVWARPELSVHLRARHALGSRASSTSLLRFRRSDVSNDSFFVESFPGTASDPVERASFSFWQSLNRSWSVFQDFDLRPNDDWSFTAGFKYEQKDLQKAYDPSYGPLLPAASLDASTYPFPPPAPATPLAQNRITTEDRGVYVQGRYRWREEHGLNLGVRQDHNSKYGGATTVRAGYVGDYGHWGAKALFGQAFQEPTPRLLYGGWTGSGSDPDLKPERSNTYEVSGTYKSPRASGLLSLYRVDDKDTLVSTAAGAQNLQDRQVLGFDVHLQALLHPPGLRQLRLWAFYSRILKAKEQLPGEPDARIGDLADDKVHLGVTAVRDGHWTATLRGRLIGARPTVSTNPALRVPAYGTLDLSLIGQNLGARGLGLSLKVDNLLDHAYADPGIRDANAGLEPGFFDGAGIWHGSGGYFNSLLPQPGRTVSLTLRLDF